mgnify:CR=1 FL=1
MKNQCSHMNNQGFSLVEVLIAIALSTIALLGLALGQLRSLQYANNSFDYTVSLIQANNAVERTWVNLCDLQNNTTPYDAAFINNISPNNAEIIGYNMAVTPAPAAGFNNNLNITVSWNDNRLTDVSQQEVGVGGVLVDVNQNQVVIDAQFPPMC